MPGYCFERMNCRNDAILLALCPCLTYMYTHTRTRIHPHISQKHCTLRHFTLLPKFFRLRASWHMCSTLLLSYMPGAFSPGHACVCRCMWRKRSNGFVYMRVSSQQWMWPKNVGSTCICHSSAPHSKIRPNGHTLLSPTSLFKSTAPG